MRLIACIAIFFASGYALAQSGANGARGSTPPGLSQDGARPAEGAIKGGSIAPGESGGMPRKDGARRDGKEAAAGGAASRLQRCYQLEGTLREQCLTDQAVSKEGAAPRAPSGSSGASASPRD